MEYSVRNAKRKDISRVMEIYANARAFMAEHGNRKQWGTSYPPVEMITQDVELGKLYVLEKEDGIHGVFYFCMEDDPTYEKIYGGAWSRDSVYGVIHRVAGDGSGRILRTAVEFAEKQSVYLRMDTHEDNVVMQRALEKLGFCKCGMIVIEDGTPRLAYDRCEEI